MIVCPNCNHQNPDGATQCEACYTPLPATTSCPNCGATVQADASFCGQCGFNLNVSAPIVGGMPAPPQPLPDVPDLVPPDPLIEPEPIGSIPAPDSSLPATVVNQPFGSEVETTNPASAATVPPPDPTIASQPQPPQPISSSPVPPPVASPASSRTQLQVQSASLWHVQTNTKIELPSNLSVIHMGKPNDQIPPDIDVSGYPNSEIVSRVHADIRVEGDAFYIEDVGSSNGTYINHSPLPKGNRHRLRPGDRISLGKGDLMTFLFQNS
ncbi:MAG TPA: FHA domain-containing protein [Coleofasciculaceae cyanobacterium]